MIFSVSVSTSGLYSNQWSPVVTQDGTVEEMRDMAS